MNFSYCSFSSDYPIFFPSSKKRDESPLLIQGSLDSSVLFLQSKLMKFMRSYFSLPGLRLGWGYSLDMYNIRNVSASLVADFRYHLGWFNYYWLWFTQITASVALYLEVDHFLKIRSVI